MSEVSSSLMALGSALTRGRTLYGVGLCELARELGLSPSFLSRIESGQARPSARVLEAYASRFRLDIDDMSRLAEIVPRDIRRHLVTSPHAMRLVRQTMAPSG